MMRALLLVGALLCAAPGGAAAGETRAAGDASLSAPPTPDIAAPRESRYVARDLSFSATVGLQLLMYAGAPADLLFALMVDGDFHLSKRLAAGAMAGVAFGTGTVNFWVGPQAKLAFVDAGPHLLYARGALSFDLLHFYTPGTGLGGTAPGASLQLGGGYRYFFNEHLAAGADLLLAPSVYFTQVTTFIFAATLAFGLELRI
jgi:hypothetical protein